MLKAVAWIPWVAALFAASAHAQTPPIGPLWKYTAADGKTEAASKSMPILIFVAGNDANSQTISKSFSDPAVVRLTKHFACVFLGKDYDKGKFQQSYVPWIGPTPQTSHSPPCLIFGDSQGNPRADLRSEGKGLSAADLAKHLQKALDLLAPEGSLKAKIERLEASKLAEIVKTLEESLTALDSKLSETTIEDYKTELDWASLVSKYVDPKQKEIKDKEARSAAAKALKDLKKALTDLGKFRGKDVDKFRELIGKAKGLLSPVAGG